MGCVLSRCQSGVRLVYGLLPAASCDPGLSSSTLAFWVAFASWPLRYGLDLQHTPTPRLNASTLGCGPCMQHGTFPEGACCRRRRLFCVLLCLLKSRPLCAGIVQCADRWLLCCRNEALYMCASTVQGLECFTHVRACGLSGQHVVM